MTAQAPFVTVVIPTYNRHALLLQALSSVFAQTFKKYNIIVVDDESSDDTVLALTSVADRVRCVTKPHGGAASARNYGLLQTQTPYVAFLDSDDLWEPSFLETTMTYLKHNAEVALIGTACITIPDHVRRFPVKKNHLKGDLFPLLFNRNFLTTSAVVAKRECFFDVGLFDETLDPAEDYDMWCRIAKRCPIAFLNQPLCRWRRHEGNTSRLKELRLCQCVLQIVQSHFDPTRIPLRTYRRRHSRLLVSLGRAYQRFDRLGEARTCFREAVLLTPFRLAPWHYLFARLLRDKCRNILRWRRD